MGTGPCGSSAAPKYSRWLPNHDPHTRIHATKGVLGERDRRTRGADGVRGGRELHFDSGSQPGSADELDAPEDVELDGVLRQVLRWVREVRGSLVQVGADSLAHIRRDMSPGDGLCLGLEGAPTASDSGGICYPASGRRAEIPLAILRPFALAWVAGQLASVTAVTTRCSRCLINLSESWLLEPTRTAQFLLFPRVGECTDKRRLLGTGHRAKFAQE